MFNCPKSKEILAITINSHSILLFYFLYPTAFLSDRLVTKLRKFCNICNIFKVSDDKAGPGVYKPSDTRHGVFFPGIDVVSSLESRFSGLPCKQIILDIAPVFFSLIMVLIINIFSTMRN